MSKPRRTAVLGQRGGIVQFLLFASFALNMALQYAQRGPWRDYRHGEVSYIMLSLAAKSGLAWLIFANVLRT
ncbi:hypothetical protein AB0880_12600 [Micromonospora chersina]|uniref:hypothetical protein n=1 Tax=Micromonospora chersina TaxID=47854 RepID=UPI00345735B0